ncbi:MAG: FixH family protein [Burkholderiales bacterium]
MIVARSAAAIVAVAGVAGHAQACGEALPGAPTIVENSRYAIAYVTAPRPIEVGRHFIVDFEVCPRTDAAAPQSVRVDANMPEHRHGMNYRAGVTPVKPGMYRAEGLLFHMPGRWDLTFDVVSGNTTERLASVVRVE